MSPADPMVKGRTLCEDCKTEAGYKRNYLAGIVLCFNCYCVRLKLEERLDNEKRM